uniref:Uncharacterized protein n=1 Tax=Cacopsylla melanoneura TaxID=428564 RepID=A0A8D8RRZ8_9HEMI
MRSRSSLLIRTLNEGNVGILQQLQVEVLIWTKIFRLRNCRKTLLIRLAVLYTLQLSKEIVQVGAEISWQGGKRYRKSSFGNTVPFLLYKFLPQRKGQVTKYLLDAM